MDMGGALGGGATIFLYCIRERELVLDLFESLTGARLLYGFHQMGGVRYDLPGGLGGGLPRRPSTSSSSGSTSTRPCSSDNAVFHMRTQGVGVISRELAEDVGICGPLLRASGVDYDLRRDAALLVLRGLPRSRCRWRPRATATRAIGADGRVPRVHQDRRARCSTACRKARSRRGRASSPSARCACPKGEAYARVEGPRGEVGCYLVGDGGPKPYRMKWRGASFSNLAVLPHIIPGAHRGRRRGDHGLGRPGLRRGRPMTPPAPVALTPRSWAPVVLGVLLRRRGVRHAARAEVRRAHAVAHRPLSRGPARPAPADRRRA